MSEESKAVDIVVPVPMGAISAALERGVGVAIARDREITEKIRAAIRSEIESPEFRQLIRTIIKDIVETGGGAEAESEIARLRGLMREAGWHESTYMPDGATK